MKLSVIIPCLNEADYIAELLEDLTTQQGIEFEVVVVDSASTDDTVAVARPFGKRLNLTVIESGRGVANARNAGGQAATGEWLLFLDADVALPDPNYLATMVGVAEAKGYVTASSIYRISSTAFMDRMGLTFTIFYQKLLSKTQHPVACGFCILTQKTAFDAARGFDPKCAVGEDYDYVSRTAGGRHRRFGFINETSFIVNLRRFEEGGKVREFFKAIGYEMYRFTHGFRIEKDPFHYTFGEHKKRP